MLYTADLVPLAAEDRLHSHFYADDTKVSGWRLVFFTADWTTATATVAVSDIQRLQSVLSTAVRLVAG